MRKIKVNEEEVEFLDTKDVEVLFEGLVQVGTKKGISEKLIKKLRKNFLNEMKKAEKTIKKGKPKLDELRKLRASTKQLEDMTKDSSSYPREVIEEILKSF